MCLNDEDCQLVMIAIDPSVPAYLDGLRGLANVDGTSKMLLLGAYATAENLRNCLNVEEIMEPASQPAILQQRRCDTDEARYLPPSYSAVAKATPLMPTTSDQPRNSMGPAPREDQSPATTLPSVSSNSAAAVKKAKTVGKCPFHDHGSRPRLTCFHCSDCRMIQLYPNSKELGISSASLVVFLARPSTWKVVVLNRPRILVFTFTRRLLSQDLHWSDTADSFTASPVHEG